MESGNWCYGRKRPTNIDGNRSETRGGRVVRPYPWNLRNTDVLSAVA